MTLKSTPSGKIGKRRETNFLLSLNLEGLSDNLTLFSG